MVVVYFCYYIGQISCTSFVYAIQKPLSQLHRQCCCYNHVHHAFQLFYSDVIHIPIDCQLNYGIIFSKCVPFTSNKLRFLSMSSVQRFYSPKWMPLSFAYWIGITVEIVVYNKSQYPMWMYGHTLLHTHIPNIWFEIVFFSVPYKIWCFSSWCLWTIDWLCIILDINKCE